MAELDPELRSCGSKKVFLLLYSKYHRKITDEIIHKGRNDEEIRVTKKHFSFTFKFSHGVGNSYCYDLQYLLD